MIDHRGNEIFIVEGLKDYISTEIRPCEVIRQNQNAPSPPYPYVTYTVTSLLPASGGTYSEAEDGTLYKNITQAWSFTVQSDSQEEAYEIAMKIYDFYTAYALTALAGKNIAVMRVQNVSPRDTFLTIEYERRVGLDIVFGLMYSIAPPAEVIETATFNKNKEV